MCAIAPTSATARGNVFWTVAFDRFGSVPPLSSAHSGGLFLPCMRNVPGSPAGRGACPLETALKITSRWFVLLAVAGAAIAAILGQRAQARTHRAVRHADTKEQLGSWENEGGTPAPASTFRPL